MKAVTIALVAIVGFLLLPYASGLIGAAVLYVVAAPITLRIGGERHRRIAAFVAVFTLFFVLVVPGIWLLAQLLGQIPDAARALQENAVIQRLMALRIGELDFGMQLQSATADIVRWSSRQTLAALSGMLNATLNLIIALFGAYYLMLSADELWDRLRAVLPFCPTTSELLRVRFHRVTEAMLLGVVLTAVAQGTLVGIAFAIIGFDHALLWGAVTAVVSILPMFGSAIVWVPAVALLIVQGRLSAAIVLGALGALVISNIDNALRLVVYRRVSHIHPMVTLLGAFGGVRAFGVAGLLLGPLVLSYAIELLRIYSLDHAPATEAGRARASVPLGTPSFSPASLATPPL